MRGPGGDHNDVARLTRLIDIAGHVPPFDRLTRDLYGGWSYTLETNVYLLARAACQISQATVAKHLGVSIETYRAWERGERAPRYDHALRPLLRNYLTEQLHQQLERRQRGQLDAYQHATRTSRRGRPIAS